MRQFYTYLHCTPNGEPFYVGKGSDGRRKRSHDFKNSRTTHHNRIVAKYGQENIRVFVFMCESEEQAFADEKQQIAQLRRDGFRLCNLTDGGDGISGLVRTPEHCKKLSERVVSSQQRMRMSDAKKGKKLTDEHKKKIGQAGIGRILSAESRAKMSAASIGKKMSDAAKRKMSEAKQGRTLSSEHRMKISLSLIGNKRASGG